MEPIEVFAGTVIQAQMLKSILTDYGIEAFLKDEVIGSMAPWYTGPGGFAPVKVMVSKNDFDKAMPLVAEFEKNIKQE